MLSECSRFQSQDPKVPKQTKLMLVLVQNQAVNVYGGNRVTLCAGALHTPPLKAQSSHQAQDCVTKNPTTSPQSHSQKKNDLSDSRPHPTPRHPPAVSLRGRSVRAEQEDLISGLGPAFKQGTKNVHQTFFFSLAAAQRRPVST
jgi:hypothetical protein